MTPSSELSNQMVNPTAYEDTMIHRVTGMESRYLQICGGVKSGKTEALLQRTSALLKKGVKPESICVIVSTANAVEAFRGRLINLAEEGRFDLSKLTVTTIQLLTIEILNCEEARIELARTPRVLTKYESAFVIQDLKAAGFEAVLIKKTLAALERLWSVDFIPKSSVSDSSDGGETDNSTDLKVFLERYLAAQQAMLPEELSYLGSRFLKQNARQANVFSFEHVLVDDFQNLSRASQMICEALAKESLAVAGNADVLIVNREAYPCPEGFTRFSQEHDSTAMVVLDRANVVEGSRNQSEFSGIGNEPVLLARRVLNIKWRNPEEEIRGISRWISKLTASKEGIALSDFYLVVPNKFWARAFEKSLTAQYQKHLTLLSGQLLSGDPRKPSNYPALVAFTRLSLLANPTDPVAWRCWCGIGLADLGADAWKIILETADAENLTVIETLARLSKPANSMKAMNPRLEELQKRYQEGKDFVERFGKKSGYALLKAIAGENSDKAFSLLIDPFEGDEDAPVTFQRAWKCALDPRFDDKLDAVRIFSYGELTGLSPRIVVLAGLNDGLMPPGNCFDDSLSESQREQIKKDYEALFKDAIGKASETLVVSTIQKAEQEMAESLKIRIVRLKHEHGKTMAMLSPSLFIQEAGDLIPGSESGQQFINRT